MVSLRSVDRRARVCLALITLTTFSSQLAAQSGAQLPTGGQVVAGQVDIQAGDHRLDLIQRTDRAVVNWQSFDIGAQDIVMLTQQGLDSAMLARVVGNAASSIQGQLKATGRLFLINQNGVVIGRDGVIDTNAFIASTLDVPDHEFMAGGPMTLRGQSTAAIVNLGTITARGGNAALLAHALINRGQISAPAATALMIAGSKVFMASLDAPDVLVEANLGSTDVGTGVENTGTIEAAQAQLRAASGNIYQLAVNQSGIVRATGVDHRNGRIVLTADGGTVGVSGELRARNGNGSGGEILVGGDYQGRNADVANASQTVVTDTAVMDANATAVAGDGGRVVVWADQATRMLGSLSATGGAEGGNGGFAEVSGQHALDFRPSTTVNLSAAAGERGTLLLDPDALRITSSADANTTSTAGNPFIFGASSEPADLNATTLANQLNSSNVRLDTSSSSGDVTFSANVTWTSNNTLTVRSGNNINVNSNLTGGATSTIDLRPGKVGTGGTTTTGNITQNAGSTIKAGTLSFGLNTNASVAGTFVSPDKMGAATFSGVLDVSTLALDLTKNIQSVSATNSGNKIGAFQTSGSPGDILGTLNVVDGSGNLDVKLVGLPDSSASAVTIVTPGKLTLLSGTSFGLGGAGTITLASTGAEFVNNAGSSAILTNQSNGNKFLIYSNTQDATVKGGLTGTDVSNKSYSANPPSDFSGDSINRFLYAGLAHLTYTAENKTRQYGASDPAFTYTVSGLASGDTLSDWVSGTPSFTTTATQSSGVGSYTINIAQGSLSSTKYQFEFTAGTLTVTKAPLTVRVNNASRIFFAANPAFSVSASGLRNGDTVSGSLSSLVFSTSAEQSSMVGDYSVTASATSSNYSLTFEPGTLTINRAPATVFAPNYTGVYGASHDLGRPTATGFHFDDLVDAFSLSSALTERSGVGTYAITPVRTGFDIRSTTLLNNYDVTLVGGTATVAPRPLTVTATSVTRRYGDPSAIFTYSVSGLAPWDDASVLTGVSVTSAAQGGIATVPGTYPITFASPGTAGANYLVTHVNGVYTVNRLPVVISGGNARVLIGLIPSPLPTTMTTLPLGGPPIVVGASTNATRTSKAGTYQILPFIQDDTLQLHQLYDISIVPGTLELVNSALDLQNGKMVVDVLYDPALYTQTQTTTTSNLTIYTTTDLNLVTGPEIDVISAKEAMDFNKTPGAYVASSVKWDVTKSLFTGVVTAPGFQDMVKKLVETNNGTGIAGLTTEQQEFLKKFADGTLSPDAVAAQLQKNDKPALAASLLGVFTAYAKALINGDIPITERSQQGLLTMLGSEVNQLRQEYATEAQNAYIKQIQQKSDTAAVNVAAVAAPNLYHDVAKAGVAAVVTKVVAGAASGAAVAAAFAGVMSIPAVGSAVFPSAAAGMSAATIVGAGAVLAVAVTAIVVEAITVAEDVKQQKEYEDLLAAAKNPITSFVGFNVGDKKNATDIGTAMLALSMEAFK